MAGSIVSEIAEVKRRVLTLERRLRDLRLVKYLHQLLDVDITYDGPGEVEDNDVLTYDATAKRWVAAAVDGGGVYSSASITGLWDGTTVSGEATEWNVATAGLELVVVSGGSTLIRGLRPDTGTGLWEVIANVQVTSGTGTPRVEIQQASTSAGWDIDGEMVCRPLLSAHDDATDGGSVSLIVPIGAVDAPWVEIDIDMGGATEVRYRLQAHLVAPLAVVDGVCGG
ncbi:MAG: hypothetical protein IPG97_16525 [Microthrixaceae bacterium]|nr:hypothetical protein [Microthrixaceae bacterium]